ncbi:MAG: prenyltransferase/squalene oxidase repeat-containing protein [Gaiellaceae bacterium]
MAPFTAAGGVRLLEVDPVPLLVSSSNRAVSFFARRDLLGGNGEPVSELWRLPEARRILSKQNADGSWRYPGGKSHVRSRENYDQLETFRRVGTLVEKLGFTREHPALERAAEFLFSFQSAEGDFRGIYGGQYAMTYVGAIAELLVKAGYGGDRRIAKACRWLLSMRQSDGGWAIPLRTADVPFSEFLDRERHPEPIEPDRSRPSSHLVTGMVLRAFAAHDAFRARVEVQQAGELLASRLYAKDAYGDRGAVGYWERVSFPFWFTDVVSALDTLTRLGFGMDTAAIPRALERLRSLQRADGTFALKLVRAKDRDLDQWICLAVCRSLARWQATRGADPCRSAG